MSNDPTKVKCPYCGEEIEGLAYVLHSERHDAAGDPRLSDTEE